MSLRGINRKLALTCVGEGWKDLINELYDNKPNDVVVSQVKEKYGELRFYVHSATNEYWNLIDECERKSVTICEVCGKTGKTINKNGWLRTLCEECNDRE